MVLNVIHAIYHEERAKHAFKEWIVMETFHLIEYQGVVKVILF